MAPGKSILHSSCEQECGIALESLKGNPAPRHTVGGISRSLLNCGRNPWVSSTRDSELRHLLIVPTGSQEDCVLGRSLLDSTRFGAMEEGLISS